MVINEINCYCNFDELCWVVGILWSILWGGLVEDDVIGNNWIMWINYIVGIYYDLWG